MRCEIRNKRYVAISKQWVTAVEDCEYTVTLLRMTLRIGHRGFQPALVKIVTLLFFYFEQLGITVCKRF